MGRMRLAALFLVALVVSLGSTAVAARARSQGVIITSLGRHVDQGGLEHLGVAVPRSAKCSLTVRYANGETQALGRYAYVLDDGLEWMWGVPTTAAVGRATARVACRGVGARTGTFVVKRFHPSGVAVIERGFTQLPDGRGGTTISWGVVLRNRSQEAARDVMVDVNFLDASGNLLVQDGVHVADIAPGSRFYAGDQDHTTGFPVLASAATVVRVGHSSSHSLVVPAVSNVQFSADDLGSAVVDGYVTNDGTAQLSSEAAIFAVLFNSAGKIIGGGLAFPASALAPGAQTAFEMDTGPGGPPASSVAEVQVSVDPAYGNS